MSCGRLSPSRGGVRTQSARQRLKGVGRKAGLSGAWPGCPCRGVGWVAFAWERPPFGSVLKNCALHSGHQFPESTSFPQYGQSAKAIDLKADRLKCRHDGINRLENPRLFRPGVDQPSRRVPFAKVQHPAGRHRRPFHVVLGQIADLKIPFRLGHRVHFDSFR